MENLSVLTGKYGDEGDQLIFKVLNSGNFLSEVDNTSIAERDILPKISEKGLRYDLTVPFARFLAMNRHNVTLPFKRYQIQPVWRADKPQKGRYREFYQCDADIIGSTSSWLEVELTLLAHDVFKTLGLEDYRLMVNHREILFGIAHWLSLGGKEIQFCAIVDKLDKIGSEKVLEQLRTLEPEGQKLGTFKELMNANSSNDQANLARLQEILGDNGGLNFMENYLAELRSFQKRKFHVVFDWTLARGLSYYTGLIFEAKPTKVRIGSILGGGRYDDLTGMFGLPDVSGVGISFGIDRIYDVLEEQGLFPEKNNAASSVLLTHFDDQTFAHGKQILLELRDSGIAAEIFPFVTKLNKQMSFANKTHVPFVLTIGENEIQNGRYALKNMETGDVEHLDVPALIKKFKTHP